MAVADSNDKGNAYVTVSGLDNEIAFWTENKRYLRLQYDVDKNTLTFLNSNHRIMKYAELIKDIAGKTQKIYIEWVQDTGKYLYFDLHSVAQKAKDVTFSASLLRYDAQNNNNGIKPSFDESASLQEVLSNDDVLLLSPIRSLEEEYTNMGVYNKHTLYLGPLPTKSFLKQCAVTYLFNCCMHGNDEELLSDVKDVTEVMFDVASWTVGQIGTDSEEEEEDEEDEDEAQQEEEEKGEHYTAALKHNDEMDVVSLQMAYLDERIDAIHGYLAKGNVQIHCLAGAHRSPFITGCYAYKYGELKGKTVQEVYAWLMGRRDVVQILGSDKWMKRYFEHLEKGQE